ncbi:MAG: N-acetyl-gamma-glutamyl-phosphate reductase [Nannocystaceae bacterium]
MPRTSSSTEYRAAVIGGTGYGGAELIRLLLDHPRVALSRVTSIDHVEESLESVHLNLSNTGLRFENIEPARAADDMDVVFLALPHKVSASLAPELGPVAAKIIDLSGDFRLRDAGAYAAFYGQTHPHPDQLGRWVYGLPELNCEQIRQATRIASPGCFATSIVLALLPLAGAGLLSGAVQTVACTGSSGSGAYVSASTHHPLRAGNLKSYRSLTHQHTPEIEQALRDGATRAGHAGNEFAINFVPVSAPLSRGILANSFVSLPADLDAHRIEELFADFYADSAFVRVLAPGTRLAEVVAVKGSMWVDLSWTLGEPQHDSRQLVVSTALDNLVKGGAGQAVQSMNLLLGLPEREGIDAPALWP